MKTHRTDWQRSARGSRDGRAAGQYKTVAAIVALVWLTIGSSARVSRAEEPTVPSLSGLDQVIVDTIESSAPDTPLKLLRAVDSLSKIGQFELAQQYLDQALALNSTDAELAALLDELGSATLVRLSLKAPLQPAMGTYAQRIYDAAERTARDPDKLAAWIRQLDDELVDRRLAALHGLRRAGPAGAAAVLTELARPDSSLDTVRLQAALWQLGPTNQPVLIAALRSGTDSTLPFHALRALRRQADQPVVPDLLKWCFAGGTAPALQNECQLAVRQALGHAPTVAEACEYLLFHSEALLSSESPLPADLEGKSQLWVWGPAGLEPRVYTQEVATLIRAAQLAADLYTIDHTSRAPRLLFAVTQLATAKVAGGLAQPLDLTDPRVAQIRAQFPPAELNSALSLALEHDVVPGAMATAELLGHLGSQQQPADPATLAALGAALRHPQRRVQFAAAAAIAGCRPARSFAAASDWLHTLTRFAASQGMRRGLVICPLRGESDQIANHLAASGWAADIATNGRQALSALYRQIDYDLILLHEATSSPKWSELVQQLRHDYRTRNIPVCLLVRGENQWLAQQLAARHAKTFIFPPPTDRQSLTVLLSEMLPSRRDDQLTVLERQQYADAALGWLAEITADRARYALPGSRVRPRPCHPGGGGARQRSRRASWRRATWAHQRLSARWSPSRRAPVVRCRVARRPSAR